jgi:hypothetical protein
MTTIEGSYSVERLDGESERAYLGYCCFRDIGLSRTLHGAYVTYLTKSNRLKSQKIGTSKRLNPSPDFRRWQIEYKWDERVKEYDRHQEESNRLAIYAADTEAFSSGIKKYRANAESIAMQQLDAVRLVQDAIYLELARVAEKATADKALNLSAMADICRVMKDVSAVAESASKRLNEAYSIKIFLADADGFFAS